MPAKYVLKEYSEHSYYHVFSRGVNKQRIFIDDSDKSKFISILKRHIDPNDKSIKSDGSKYRKFNEELTIVAYCLMNNHFHMMIKVRHRPEAMSDLFRATLTAFTMHFNWRHNRVGPLFQSRYKAKLIKTESHFLHLSRYIHLNPERYRSYSFSSLDHYLGHYRSDWIQSDEILSIFGGPRKYLDFLQEYEHHREELKYIKEYFEA